MFISVRLVNADIIVTLPQVKGLSIEFVDVNRTSQLFFGTCDNDADTSIEGVVKVLSKEEYDNEKYLETSAARKRRDQLLKDNIDSINPIRWENMSNTQKDSIRLYRQALLDVPQQENFPFSIRWPILSNQ